MKSASMLTIDPVSDWFQHPRRNDVLFSRHRRSISSGHGLALKSENKAVPLHSKGNVLEQEKELSRTNFMNRFMNKLKKERKRQEKKKSK